MLFIIVAGSDELAVKKQIVMNPMMGNFCLARSIIRVILTLSMISANIGAEHLHLDLIKFAVY